MNDQTFTCLAISDFNVDNAVGYLTNNPERPAVQAIAAPFGQVIQVLMDDSMECWKHRPEMAIIWTQPHAVIESFRQLHDHKTVSLETILKEVDSYASVLMRVTHRVKCAIVPSWVVPASQRASSMQDMKHECGIANILMRMNLRLAEHLDQAPNMHLLNAQKWIEASGQRAVNPKLWYMAKVPFGNEVFREAAKDVKAVLRGIHGQAKKLILLDLDETLWGGTVGETGWERLLLGGHDPVGEAFVDFQQALKALSHRGILLGVVSKNQEDVALEAIEKHPEMVLRTKDLAGWKINWQDKAQNVVDLVSELNLGLQSVVFLDDNPLERARVREALPEVLVPEWPDDPMLYRQALFGLSCFDAPSVSQEDRERTQMYVTERERTRLKTRVGSLDEWLQTLEMMVKIDELNSAHLPRAVQLLNKTNQMNLSTRRMTESELSAWADRPDRRVWTVHVSDKFGSSGLTGLVSVEVREEIGTIVDYLLSCRVMGRKVEETMLAVAIQYLQSRSVTNIVAHYRPTKNNAPILEFWKRSGLRYDEATNAFHWDPDRSYPVPPQITLKVDAVTPGRPDQLETVRS